MKRPYLEPQQGWRKLARYLLLPLCKLNRIRFEAPWRSGQAGC